MNEPQRHRGTEDSENRVLCALHILCVLGSLGFAESIEIENKEDTEETEIAEQNVLLVFSVSLRLCGEKFVSS
jgi:hypothetical protein